ncbi:hypothetical protein THTE_4341 [Thermogutta terrifontis]|uniref:Uncharacterized protein n=1 Tax=Thermogutta terrifontis TaxID=1331910 RepID=A0A286RLV8_9BACT|nr:hypothetical protein THTE_4341 [Thermogutta terrifontis]
MLLPDSTNSKFPHKLPTGKRIRNRVGVMAEEVGREGMCLSNKRADSPYGVRGFSPAETESMIER